jgi:hypothetical protein
VTKLAHAQEIGDPHCLVIAGLKDMDQHRMLVHVVLPETVPFGRGEFHDVDAVTRFALFRIHLVIGHRVRRRDKPDTGSYKLWGKGIEGSELPEGVTLLHEFKKRL